MALSCCVINCLNKSSFTEKGDAKMLEITLNSKRKAEESTCDISAKAVRINNDKVHDDTQFNLCNRLRRDFFDVPCIDLAKSLLGTILVRKISNDVILRARIVETECYPGGLDAASHSYMGRKTPRNAPMYGDPGTTYVYTIHGVYYCFNISSNGDGSAVLIRALEPVENKELMLEFRKKKLKNTPKVFKGESISNGPSKLCIAMCIDKSCNNLDLCHDDNFWLERDDYKPNIIICSKRIGIGSTGLEAVNKEYRFYLHGNQFVSKRDRQKEKESTANT